MVKKILIGSAVLVVAVVLILVAVVAMQPSEFTVSRSATVSASPATVFAHVNDFHKWEDWSPWAKLDPSMKTTYDGPAEGVGAKQAWAGNDKVGEGRMTITESKPGELVLINLEFIKPFESTCTTQFAFKPEGEGTKVSWTMSGKNDFMGKAFSLMMNMDKMIGADFEKGLAAMKKVAEASPKPETPEKVAPEEKKNDQTE